MNLTRIGLLTSATAFGMLITGGTPVYAQSADTASAPDSEVVIVTAQRRAEDIQSVPLAVSAFDGRKLQAQNVFRVEDLASKVPSFFISSPTVGTTRMNIRGIGSEPNNVGLGNSIPNYVDGVAIGPGRSVDLGFFDLAGVEVLRGPQGTLFGRNAVGGAVLVRTNQPRLDTLEGGFSVTAGNYNAQKLTGYFNAGSERSAIRIAGNLDARDGYSEQRTRGGDVNEVNSTALRVQALFKLSEALTLTLRADQTKDDVNGNEKFFVTNASGGINNPAIRTFASLYDQPTLTDRETSSLGAELSYVWGDYKFVSLTNYANFDYANFDDIDYTAANVLVTTAFLNQEQWSQEFRIESPADKRLSWIAGLYYFQEELDARNDASGQFATFGGAPNATTLINLLIADRKTTAYAVFGQADFKLTDKLSLIGGLRFTTEESEVNKVQPNGRQALGINPLNARVSSEDGEWSGTAKITFKPTDDVLFYGGYSRGFKASGFNLNPGGVADISADPEFVDAYEAGVRSDLLDRKLRLNATAFLYKYTDLQRSTFVTPAGGGITTIAFGNAGEVESKGFELEAQVRPTTNLTLGGTYSYVDAVFENYLERQGNGTIIDRSGNTPSRTPENTWSAYLDYDRTIGAYRLGFRFDWQYRDDTFLQDSNVTSLKTDEVNIGNIRFSLEKEGGPWEVAAFVRNITDEAYILAMTAATGFVAGVGADLGAPRTYGLQVNFNF
jgi:iron complex outermembrane recepter protein